MSNPIGRSSPQTLPSPQLPASAAPADAATATAQAVMLQSLARTCAQAATQVTQQSAALQQAAQQVPPNSPQAAAIQARLQQMSAQTDLFVQATERETMTALNAEQRANRLTVGAPAPFPLTALGASLAQGIGSAHGDAAALAFAQHLADLLAAKPDATEEDVRQAALGASMTAAQSEADELQKKLPPDEQRVDLNPASSGQQMVDGWKRGALAGVGPGNPATVKAFLERESGTLTHLASLTSSIVGAHPFARDTDRLYAPALQALKATFPSASMELVGVTHDAAKSKGSVMIRMALPGKDNTQKSYAFTFHPEALTSEATKKKLEAEILADPRKAAAFNQTLQQVAPDQAKATAKESFAALNTPRGRTALAQALLALPPAAMADLLPTSGSGGRQLLGGLLQLDKLAPQHALVRIDGDSLAAAQNGQPVKTQVSIVGAQDASKAYNFLNQHALTLLAPQFLQAMQVGTQTYASQGVDLDNAVGTAVGLQPSNPSPKAGEAAFTGKTAGYIAPIASQIRSVMKDAGVKAAKVTALPVVYNSSEPASGGSSDGAGLALFRVDAGKVTRFVDQSGRSYKDLNDWRANNQLPAGRISYPAEGQLKLGADGNPEIVTENTSATVDTLWKSVKEKGTALAGDMGMFAAGVGLAAFGSKLRPVAALAERSSFIKAALEYLNPMTKGSTLLKSAQYAGMAAGPVFGYLSAQDINDRRTHGQEWKPFVHPLQNSQVSGDWLMLASMGFGYGGMARQAQVDRQALAEGQNITHGTYNAAMQTLTGGTTDARGLVQKLNHASFAAGTGLMADFWLQMAQQWGQMTPEQRKSQLQTNLFWTLTMPQQISEFRAERARAAGIPGAAGVGATAQ